MCVHVSRQLFSTAVLMGSLGPRVSFNVCLTTFHNFLPKQIMLQQYVSCAWVRVILFQVVNILISCGQFSQMCFEIFLLGKDLSKCQLQDLLSLWRQQQRLRQTTKLYLIYKPNEKFRFIQANTLWNGAFYKQCNCVKSLVLKRERVVRKTCEAFI